MTDSAVLTMGEALGLLSPNDYGPVVHSSHLRLRIAGAEANVAVGVRRLGHPTTWVGRLGNDPIGDLVVRELTAEQVTVVAIRDDAPTSLMVKERRTANLTNVHYWRRHGAGSCLTADDIPEDQLRAVRVVHLTGITPALGTGPRAAVMAAVETAGSCGATVSFDVNFRSKLWEAHEAAPVLRDVVKHADIVFAGVHEAGLVTGCPGARLLDDLAALGPSTVLLKRGPGGADALIEGRRFSLPAHPARGVDAVGAGDAFAAGYLAALLHGWPPETRMDTATRLGAIAVSTDGGWEGLPHQHELDDFAGSNPVQR